MFNDYINHQRFPAYRQAWHVAVEKQNINT